MVAVLLVRLGVFAMEHRDTVPSRCPALLATRRVLTEDEYLTDRPGYVTARHAQGRRWSRSLLLRPVGVFAMEHDDTHAESVPALLATGSVPTEVEDLTNRPRFVMLWRTKGRH